MRLPDGNISAAHLSVFYSRLVHQHDPLLVWRLEITESCLNPDDFVRHDNGRGTHAVHVLTMFRQTVVLERIHPVFRKRIQVRTTCRERQRFENTGFTVLATDVGNGRKGGLPWRRSVAHSG
jgi:hypothetical protein